MGCGNPDCECGDEKCGPDCTCGHDHDPTPEGQDATGPNAANPFANLDNETQQKIQELQMLEQNFQQLLMQKNAFSMEGNETNLIMKELEKTSGEVSRIIGGQVVIKTTKEELMKEMEKKKELIDNRMKAIDEQEKEFSERLETLREEVMGKLQA